MKYRKPLAVAVLALVAFAVAYNLFKPKPNLKIYDPRKEINAVQDARDRDVNATFDGIDQQREADDRRIREANTRKANGRNVNAKELEEILKR